jgi:hypothetical protein
MAAGDEYAAQGARLTCNQSPVPSTFHCLNPLHQVEGHDIGTELDFIPLFNVPAFGTPCKILTQAAGGTPVPCVPFPTPWQGAHPGFMTLGRKLLLNSSYSYCVFGGKIEFATSGQGTASLGDAALFGAVAAPSLPTGKVLVLAPGDKTVGWTAELNKVPLEPNAKYLVGTYLYETDAEGRVARTRGVLTLQAHERNETEQNASVRLKNGRANPAYIPDPRPSQQKKRKLPNGRRNPAYKRDTRRSLQRRAFIDDGGHLYGAQFNGAGEQINYVPQHMDLNQRRKNTSNWYAMEDEWAQELRKTPPSHIYTETELGYPNQVGSSLNQQSMRPDMLAVEYWVEGKSTTQLFSN